MGDDFCARPLITPESVELAVMVGATDLELLAQVFGVAVIDEPLWDALAVLVRCGMLDKYVSHEDPLNVRVVYETAQTLDFSEGDTRG